MRVYFKLEKVLDSTGQEIDTLVKYTQDNPDAAPDSGEEWCTVQDLDRLFETCTTRWPVGWDLEKVMTAVRECDFD
jgi:hypothetical protein